MSADEWEKVRKHRYSDSDTPPEWPAEVRAISIDGVSLFGVHQSSGELYWDGHAVVTEKRLANYERRLALAVTLATVVMAVVEVLRAIGVAH
ncbi:hypothetical protein FJ976_02770 [Mesorhizobium sp. B1-1-9]|uniref:hypothetical protein n=1 Tax=Mesorhizobium sp. B1-1-9 TaxID=2589975 RepID=UPI00112C2584|nr:hypothetical protein [Mesorhizobium sp. B1-1-9]TPN57578.1 hypothetical protein FJ976_02770 [Mesorhizobium sp. B1-1-9]